MSATCCHLEEETKPYKIRHFSFSHARYLNTSIWPWMICLAVAIIRRSIVERFYHADKVCTDQTSSLGPARRVKMKTLLIEQASARVWDSRGSLISARFCQSRPYIRHYTVRSYLYSLRIIQRICFVCQFMLYPVACGVLQNSANSKIDVRFIYYY